MARERRHREGERLGVLMSWMSRTFAGQEIDPGLLNPYREEPAAPEVKDEVRQELEHKAGWRALERALFGRVVTER